MPLPLVFIGIAAVTGATGVGATVKAGVNQSHAKNINDDANQRIENAANRLDYLRKQCGDSLQHLGEEKVFVLNNGINEFITNFQKIKNVDFAESEGIMELKRLNLDKKEFDELAEMTKFSFSLVQGGITGAAGGALAAFGAYSAATTFATASTGTAIASLSGAAASNATLAFFGGGSLAAGGLGMAGGTAVLGGLVAGPALLVMGIITSAKAGKSLQDAYANEAKANEICEELQTASEQCIAIRRRSYMFYSLLAKLDAYLYPLNEEMKRIILAEGTDYSQYCMESKKSIAALVSTVASIKSVLDTTILSESGELTNDSSELLSKMIE
ncbi:MAG: hypothetical protein J1D87_02665 [Lachnospiraceae bacterium]|nr:hypothetical protein [Lachnospiraceae bacterium]